MVAISLVEDGLTARYLLRRPSLRSRVASGLTNGAIALLFIVIGPPWVKALFALYLLGNLIILLPVAEEAYILLGPNALLLRSWKKDTTIPYRHIRKVKVLSAEGLRFYGLRKLRRDPTDVHVEVLLDRLRWFFTPVPFPLLVPTKQLHLTVKDGPEFLADLARRYGPINGPS